jgi:hypothetical protein
MPTDSTSLLRRGLLVLLLIGAVGLVGELILLEHYEDRTQLIPFGLLVTTMVVTGWHWWANNRRTLRIFQAVMMLLIIAGPVGIYLHVAGNYEMEREFDPSLLGLDLWMEVIRGEAPSLAPGTLVQFGLLGLLYAYRHPLLSSTDTTR